MDDAMTHVTTGAAVVYLLQWLKHHPRLSFVTDDTTQLNRWLSALAAGLLAFGINWTGDAVSGWTIHIPPLSLLLAGGWEWMKQLAVQQLLYDGVAQPAGTPRLGIVPRAGEGTR